MAVFLLFGGRTTYPAGDSGGGGTSPVANGCRTLVGRRSAGGGDRQFAGDDPGAFGGGRRAVLVVAQDNPYLTLRHFRSARRNFSDHAGNATTLQLEGQCSKMRQTR